MKSTLQRSFLLPELLLLPVLKLMPSAVLAAFELVFRLLCACYQCLRCVIAVLLLCYKRWKLVKSIPYIAGDPIDGCRDMQMARNDNFNLHAEMLALHAEHGPVLQTFWRGQHLLVVNHPMVAAQVFKEAPNKIQLNLLLDTVLHRDKDDGRGEAFKKAMGPSLKRFLRLKKNKILLRRFCSVLEEHARSGSLIDPSELFGSFALDYLYGVLFDRDENFMRKKCKVFERLRGSAEFIFDNMEQTPPTLSRPSTWLDFFLDLPVLNKEKLKKRGEDWKFLQSHCKTLLKKLKKKHASRVANLLRMLNDRDESRVMGAQAMYDDYMSTFVPVFLNYAAEHNWTEEAMVRELAIFVLAGHETTANAMTWMLFEMVRNDGVQEKCREVVAGLKQSPPIKDLTSYLMRVIKESMRLNPVVSRPMLRVSDKDIFLKLPSGETVKIAAGTGFLVNIYALHNSPDNWENPTFFDPDRFDGSPNTKDELRFIPFSYGGRQCPGQSIALAEMQSVLEVLTEYEFAFQNEDMKTQDRRELQRSSITMRPVDGLRMRVTKPAAPAPIAPIN